MPTDLIRESLTLMPEDWDRLEELAREHRTLAPTGPTAGQPSWRSLIKEIARGRFTLVTNPEETTPDD
jgi:hypothetical protein